MPYPHAFYEAASAFVYLRLQTDAETLPPDVLGTELTAVADAVYSGQPGLPAYANLSAADMAAFAAGVGKVTSARLYGSMTTGAGGQAVRIQNEGDSVQFAGRNSDEPTEWIKDAAADFARMSYFRAQSTASAVGFSMYGLAGPSRDRLATGRATLLDMLTGLCRYSY